MKTIYAIDFNKWAAKTYKLNFPETRVRCGRIEDYVHKLPYADIILGGPPCPGFSTSGKGLGRLDPRDGWGVYIQAVAKVKPRMFLAENVSGILAKKHRDYFHEIIDRLTACGYAVRFHKQNAVHYGAPQHRKRVWVWGIRNDLFESGLRHRWPARTHAWPHQEPNPFLKNYKPKHELPPAVVTQQALSGLKLVIKKTWPIGYWGEFSKKHPYARMSKPAPTLSCNWIGRQSTGMVEIPNTKLLRNLTPKEGMRIQTVPDSFLWPKDIGVGAKTNIIGNGWACAHAAAFARAFAEVDPESETCIDLFCGGGLGACGWHQRYWQPL
jgi:DNA-cytosine methyltransferase